MPAGLVLAAAQPWSPQTHELFPAAVRAHAVEVLVLGHRLSREPSYETVAQGIFVRLVGGRGDPARGRAGGGRVSLARHGTAAISPRGDQ